MRYQTILNEDLSIDQHQEMDADAFALDSLIKPAKIIGTYWHQYAINFFMQMELVSGQHSGLDHPTAINRVYYSDSLRSDFGEAHDISPRPEFFKNIASRYTSTKQYTDKNKNSLINTSRDGCIQIIRETNEVLKQFNIDISPLWERPSHGWLEAKIK